MRMLFALVAMSAPLLLVAPASAETAPAGVSTACAGEPCDTINRLCRGCIPDGDARASSTSPSASDCLPSPCETVNSVCRKALHIDCVRSGESDAVVSAETRCAGPLCDAINVVCQVAFKAPCVR